ncbi:HigA family addiction module antitoxin [Marinobacter sp. ELB17]|uniref:HigA family addiction module antitoxin n=1 Tax=Marinobacter sp. ELB17 TaxID=270374 RepID=UPI0000F37027|nr:HigA family addiction module antitoxin [Marinobacter sp. ELB17]EAZ97900.1 transcriptional regulator, XRE family protein [Marinobacter sp. ELB17]
MLMHNPPYPGEVLRELCLEPLGLSVTVAAEALGVSRKTLSAVLNGRAGISPEMAIRLSIAFAPKTSQRRRSSVFKRLIIARTTCRRAWS